TTGQVVHLIEIPCSSGLTDIGGGDEGREEHGPAEQRGRGEIPFPWSRGAARRCLQRSCRVVEGREPAVHILDIIHQVSAAGTIPGGKAGRAARRAHVRAISATRAGDDVGGIEEVVAFSELARTSAGDNASIIHPDEVVDVRNGIVYAGNVSTGLV